MNSLLNPELLALSGTLVRILALSVHYGQTANTTCPALLVHFRAEDTATPPASRSTSTR